MRALRMLSIIIGVMMTACTGHSKPSQPEKQNVTALCLPTPAELTSPLRGQRSTTGVDIWSIDCGDGFAWPCERGVQCTGEGVCVCRCDADYVDNDCGRVALAQWFPGAFEAWSFSCHSGRCVVARSDDSD